MASFSKAIPGQLEVAMGLETIHPNAIEIMNKGMSLADFDRAVAKCQSLNIDVRVFVLLHPPGVDRKESVDWTWKTVAYAMERQVRHISIIPLRAGNGWIDRMIKSEEYQLPTVAMIRELYQSFSRSEIGSAGVASPGNTTVEFDLWDFENWQGGCPQCRESLGKHIARCNRELRILSLGETEIRCECTV
jgi:uncharacterized Fe-S cluster-containing MiaB family protein